MNSFLDFLRSRAGLTVLGLGAVAMLVAGPKGCRAQTGERALPLFRNTNALTQIQREAGAIPVPKPPPFPVPPPLTNPPRPSIILVLDGGLPSATNAASGPFAPAGRLLRCVLVNAIESIRIDTPLIGLVTEDLYFQGHLVVPAGTEVHGKAQVDRVRERIAANGSWTLVFPDGEELVVKGVVLERDEAPGREEWGLKDGLGGLEGQVIKSGSLEELKLFAAAFLSGWSDSLQQTETTIFGSRNRRSLPNAALSGSSAVLDHYAKTIAEGIQRDGVYVRVPGGKPFYLYLPQTLDRAAARVGATRKQNL